MRFFSGSRLPEETESSNGSHISFFDSPLRPSLSPDMVVKVDTRFEFAAMAAGGAREDRAIDVLSAIEESISIRIEYGQRQEGRRLFNGFLARSIEGGKRG